MLRMDDIGPHGRVYDCTACKHRMTCCIYLEWLHTRGPYEQWAPKQEDCINWYKAYYVID